jgi:hypothetical protein
MSSYKSAIRTTGIALAVLFLSAGMALQAYAARPAPRIIDGTPASEMDYPYVANLLQGGEMFCTGTLVGPKHVLTAGHCFFDEKNRRVVGDTDVTVRLGGQQIQSAGIQVHPAYVSRSSACVEGETDAALVELAETVSGISPIPVLDAPAPVGATVLLAGYGTQGSGSTGEDGTLPPTGVLNVGSTVIDGYGDNPPQQNLNSSYFYWTFERGESNTASGDSGGPAFYSVNGQFYLAGITCGGEGKSEYGTASFQTRTDLIVSWIQSIAGVLPADSPPSFPQLAPKSAWLGGNFSYAVPVSGSEPLELSASNLPEGLSLSGRTISGVPAAAGSYSVGLSAANPFGSASSSLVIVVSGYNPALAIKKALLQFDDDKNNDFLDVTGTILVTPNFKPRGKRVMMRIGRFSKTFRLASNGQSTGNGRSYFDLYGSLKTGKAKFDLTFERVPLAEELSTLGFPSTADAVGGQEVALPLSVTIDGVESSATVTLRFGARDERWRIAK